MALSNNDEAKIREYLLGKLSGDEQEKIEDRLMLEDGLFEEFEISKEELIEDYRLGQLNQVERQWFENHFLATPEGRQKYTFALALDCVKRPPVATPSLFERIREFFTIRPLFSATVSAGLVLVVGALIFSSIKQPSTGFASINLTSTNLARNEGPPVPEISLAGVSELRADLELKQPVVSANGYRAELDNTNEIKPVTVVSHDTSKVVVTIPASELPPGRYALKLIAKLADGQEQRLRGHYYFNVENER